MVRVSASLDSAFLVVVCGGWFGATRAGGGTMPARPIAWPPPGPVPQLAQPPDKSPTHSGSLSEVDRGAQRPTRRDPQSSTDSSADVHAAICAGIPSLVLNKPRGRVEPNPGVRGKRFDQLAKQSPPFGFRAVAWIWVEHSPHIVGLCRSNGEPLRREAWRAVTTPRPSSPPVRRSGLVRDATARPFRDSKRLGPGQPEGLAVTG